MTTSAPLEDLASYVPALILRRMAADIGSMRSPSVERFPAAALFADLSGFTALTEQFSLHNPAGTEELTQILDLYFGHLVRVVTAHGGDVVKFAGDGLLALWYGDEDLPHLAQRAVQCGLAVQMMMSPDVWGSFDGVRTPAPLKMRVGIGAGEVTTMHIGGVFGRWELLVTGDPLRQTGQAEAQARPGDVVISAEAWPLVAQGCVGEPTPSGGVRLDSLTDYLPMRKLDVPPLQMAMADSLRSYLPKAILARMDAGQTGWLAEQRRVTVLFVNLPDLRADTPLHQAHALMQAIQSMLYRFEGSVSRLGTDAKGPTLVAALGLPPLAHEDDPERGARAALAIHAALADLGFACAIGVTTGQALCGAVGGDARREYTMMGSIVNRSARLMQAAAVQSGRDGGLALLCDAATAHAARYVLHFDPLPPLALKGVSELVPVYRPQVDSAKPQGHDPQEQVGALIGRQRELATLTAMVESLAQSRRGGVILIEGDAGIGKTRLLGELHTAARAAGILTCTGVGNPIDSAPYGVWRAIFGALIPTDGLSEILGADLDALAPLLRAVLHIDLPDTPITAQMSGQVRADNTRDLLVRLLARVARGSPLVISIEDAQWLDASSWALLLAVAERVDRLLLAVATRPLSDTPPEYQRMAYLPDTRRIQLHGLEPEQVRDLLAQRLAVDTVPHDIWQMIAARSQGNPFFSEEMLYALRDGGQIVVVGRECQVVTGVDDTIHALHSTRMPDTVQGLITSRIDRLTPAQQLTLKVSSVIGQSFSLATLSAIHPVERDPSRLVDQLFTLQQAGLVVVDFDPIIADPERITYTFKHAAAAEVAYNLMSFRQRRQLHRALAERYEASGDPADNVAQLAHHWRQADDLPRAMGYLATAGEHTLRAGAYREASGFLREAIQIAEGLPSEADAPDQTTRARWEWQLGEAYHGMGRLNESRELLERAAARLGYPAPEGMRAALPALARELLRHVIRVIRGREASPPMRNVALGEAANTYTILARLAYYNSQIPAAIYATVRSLNLAEQLGPSPELAGAYAAAHLVAGPLPPLAAFYRRRAQAMARQIGHLPTHAWVAESQGLTCVGQGDWRRAGGALSFAQAIADSLGDQRRRAECRALLALCDLFQGNFATAVGRCADLYAAGQVTGDVQVCAWGLIGQAEALLNMGDVGRAVILLDTAAGLLAENLGSTRAEEIWAYALRARAALLCGERHLAQSLVRAAADLVGPLPPAAIYALGGYAAIAEVWLELWESDREDGADLAAGARRACATLGLLAGIYPVARPTMLIWWGRYAWACGRHVRAHGLWRGAAAMAARLGLPYEQGRALLALGRHTHGQARRGHLRQAVAIFTRIDAARDLALARALGTVSD